MVGHEIAHRHVTAGDGAGDDQGAGLDPVGNDPVRGAGQRRHALDLDPRGTGAVDASSHRVEARGEIRHLGLARGILDDRRALSERCRHHEVLGARHGHHVEGDRRAAKPAGSGDDVAVLDRDLRTELGQALQVLIDGAHADRASAGQRDARRAVTGDERAEHEDRGTHGRHELVRRLVLQHSRDADAGASVVAVDGRAQRLQQANHRADVLQIGEVGKDERLGRQQRGRQRRQRRVLRRADLDGAPQRNAALDLESCRHSSPPAVVNRRQKCRNESLDPDQIAPRRNIRESCRAHEASRLGNLIATGGLEDERTARREPARGLGDERADHAQTVGSAIEGDPWLVVDDFRGQAGQHRQQRATPSLGSDP